MEWNGMEWNEWIEWNGIEWNHRIISWNGLSNGMNEWIWNDH